MKKDFSGFPVKIHTNEDGSYWAEFLSVPVFTQGETLAELETNMQEALICASRKMTLSGYIPSGWYESKSDFLK